MFNLKPPFSLTPQKLTFSCKYTCINFKIRLKKWGEYRGFKRAVRMFTLTSMIALPPALVHQYHVSSSSLRNPPLTISSLTYVQMRLYSELYRNKVMRKRYRLIFSFEPSPIHLYPKINRSYNCETYLSHLAIFHIKRSGFISFCSYENNQSFHFSYNLFPLQFTVQRPKCYFHIF